MMYLLFVKWKEGARSGQGVLICKIDGEAYDQFWNETVFNPTDKGSLRNKRKRGGAVKEQNTQTASSTVEEGDYVDTRRSKKRKKLIVHSKKNC